MQSETRFRFITDFGDTAFVLVRVCAEGELLAGLNAAPTDREPPLPSRPDADTLSDVRRFETATDAASSEPFDVHALRRLLRQGAYFVAPLRKRRAAMLPSSARITLGRAYDNDVVLRDPSVSQFHAWVEYDEKGRFFVGDMRSKNGTYLHGRRLEPMAFERLREGSEVRFGNVTAFFCTPDLFWDAVRKPAAALRTGT